MAAHDAYEEALNLEPSNEQAQSGMSAVKRAIDAEVKQGTPADPTGGLGGIFNDPTMYHNRGDSTFAGESSEYGDFVGTSVSDASGGYVYCAIYVNGRKVSESEDDSSYYSSAFCM